VSDYARSKGGHFAKGNKGGPGNPYARAKDRDLGAAKEVLVRTLGRPLEADLLERIERLEHAVAGDASSPG
jgi:hypothetical protein